MGDYLMIQEGINAAFDGDTVLVLPCIYYENIYFSDKDIVLMSSNGPEETIIDGMRLNSVIQIISEESHSVVIDGFTITNGKRGIHIENACPIIENNIIENNTGIDCYAGIYVLFGDYPNPSRSKISHNQVRNNNGDAIFVDNYAPVFGVVTISYNQILDNEGSGIFLWCWAENEISGNLIANNGGSVLGGGIRILFGGNIINNTIDSNTALEGGGIWYIWDYPDPTVIKNNIVTNNTAEYSGGICAGLWINTYAYGQIEQYISYNDVWGNFPDNYSQNLHPGPGDISENPLFVNPENFDFHLQPDSPCINTGDPRLRDPDLSKSDMGCYWYDEGFVKCMKKLR
jgi:parallel beta-helix repeat protein